MHATRCQTASRSRRPEVPSCPNFLTSSSTSNACTRASLDGGWRRSASSVRSCCGAWTRRRPSSRATVRGLRRLGKRIVFALDDEMFLVLHLMIAGRLHWKAQGAKPPGRIGLAAFDFANGTLILTEAGTKRRASLHLVRGDAGLAEHQPGGLEVLDADLAAFRAALLSE